MARSAAGSAAIWFLSCAPIALPAVWGPAESSLGDASRTALVLLPWLAWIGLPRSSTGVESSASALGTAALSVPLVAAAVGIDLGHGRPVAWLVGLAVSSLAMIALLGVSSRNAALGTRRMAFAWAWLVLVPGLPMLRCALELGGAPGLGTAPGWLVHLADASPIAWVWSHANSVEADTRGFVPSAGLAVCVVLFAIAGAPNRTTSSSPAEVRAQ